MVMARCTFLVHAQESAKGFDADPLAEELILQLSVGILDKGIRHQQAESRKPHIILFYQNCKQDTWGHICIRLSKKRFFSSSLWFSKRL